MSSITNAAGLSVIAQLAGDIRSAMLFLCDEQKYRLEEIRIVTGGGSLLDGHGEKITIDFEDDEARKRYLRRMKQYGIADEQLHKNSVLKIRDLRYTLAVRRFRKTIEKTKTKGRKAGKPVTPVLTKAGKPGKLLWVAAKKPREKGDDGKRARMAWLWSPQIDTFEHLERLVTEARALGWYPGRPAKEATESAAAELNQQTQVLAVPQEQQQRPPTPAPRRKRQTKPRTPAPEVTPAAVHEPPPAPVRQPRRKRQLTNGASLAA